MLNFTAIILLLTLYVILLSNESVTIQYNEYNIMNVNEMNRMFNSIVCNIHIKHITSWYGFSPFVWELTENYTLSITDIAVIFAVTVNGNISLCGVLDSAKERAALSALSGKMRSKKSKKG